MVIKHGGQTIKCWFTQHVGSSNIYRLAGPLDFVDLCSHLGGHLIGNSATGPFVEQECILLFTKKKQNLTPFNQSQDELMSSEAGYIRKEHNSLTNINLAKKEQSWYLNKRTTKMESVSDDRIMCKKNR